MEAWVLEMNSVETRLAEVRNVSNRKLAMTLASFDSSNCRDLSVSEKMCIVDIINRFIKGQKAQLQFYTKSKKIDCFEAVEFVCRNVDWFEMKRAQRLRIEGVRGSSSSEPASQGDGVSSRPTTAGDVRAESAGDKSSQKPPGSASGANGAAATAPSIPDVPLPADSPVLRSLLELADVELTHHTVDLGKSFIKRDIWASLMSEATGWRDIFNWVPAFMTGGGAKEVTILRDNKVSAKNALAYYEYSRRNDDKYIRSKHLGKY